MVCGIEATVGEWRARNFMRSLRAEAATAADRPERPESEWAIIEDTILKALLPFNEARAAVTRALAELVKSP